LISEVSLALALVVSTVLLAKSLGKLLEANGLFRPDQLLALDLSFSNAALRASPDPDQMEINLCHQLEERVAGIAGVRAVALVDRFPLQTLGGSPDRFRADGGGAISENYEPAELHFVTPTYFDIMGARLVRGRPLTGADAARSLPVALINEAMAERYWRGADPLGRKLTPFWRRTSEDVAYTIVGVIHEPRRFGEGGKPEPAVYIGLSQWPVPYFSVLVRSDGDRLSIASALHAAALQILPGQMFVGKVRSGGDLVSESSARLRFVTLLLFASSGLGLLLAVVGIYALVSYYTAQRTHEIGLRMALGASPKQVLRLVLKEGMALVGCGVLLGLVIALGLGRGLASLLYQVAPTDFSAFCGAALVLLVVALVAIYIPARRATRADPMAAVRYE
jgi:putative ABC transport system permease protein